MKRMLSLGYLTIISFLVLRTAVFATSVVAIVEDGAITIAADSVLQGQSVTGEPASQPYCKLQCRGHLCFAASGRYAIQTIQYNVFDLADGELRRTQFPDQAAAGFRESILATMPNLLDASKKETPLKYLEWKKGRAVLSYLFAGFELGGKASVIHGSINIDSAERVLPIEEKVRRGAAGEVGLVMIGWNNHALEFVNTTPDWGITAIMDSVGFAERLIGIEIAASEKDGRHDVGEPISVVKLTQAGFVLQKPGHCLRK